MCGCGCELGLVLAACRAGEAQHTAASRIEAAPRPHSVLERLVLVWLACMAGDTRMQRLSRGSAQ